MTEAIFRPVALLATALVGTTGVAVAATSSAATHSSGPVAVTAAQPASWFGHDLIVRLQHLPGRYSCDDLWYRFRDVLQALGARPDFRILAYGCEKSLGSDARSPEVHLNFYLPQLLEPAQAKWADVAVHSRRVAIQPGMGTWKAGDCNLLGQIKSTLLAKLNSKVVDFRLACDAPQSGQPPFELTVSTLQPVTTSKGVIASVSPHVGDDARIARDGPIVGAAATENQLR